MNMQSQKDDKDAQISWWTLLDEIEAQVEMLIATKLLALELERYRLGCTASTITFIIDYRYQHHSPLLVLTRSTTAGFSKKRLGKLKIVIAKRKKKYKK